MIRLFEAMLGALRGGRDAVLCTILASSGSSPRGAGSRMAVFETGETMGTVGGGAVELEAVRQARTLFVSRQSVVRGFELARSEVEDIGMVCGGSVTIYYQFFDHADTRSCEVLSRLVEVLGGQTNAWLLYAIAQGALSQMGLYDEERGMQFFDALTEEALRPMLSTRAVYESGEPIYYVEPIVRRGRVYIFGGGHVGEALCPVLSKVDFSVTMFDNRQRVAQPEVFPQAQQVILGDYTRIGDFLTLTQDDYAVVMTPGHQSDFEVLEQVLRTPATYIGCIGSSRKVAAVKARLMAAGISEADTARLHSPIGLSIGAQTPDEIAISIAAEMIAHRARRRA